MLSQGAEEEEEEEESRESNHNLDEVGSLGIRPIQQGDYGCNLERSAGAYLTREEKGEGTPRNKRCLSHQVVEACKVSKFSVSHNTQRMQQQQQNLKMQKHKNICV